MRNAAGGGRDRSRETGNAARPVHNPGFDRPDPGA